VDWLSRIVLGHRDLHQVVASLVRPDAAVTGNLSVLYVMVQENKKLPDLDSNQD